MRSRRTLVGALVLLALALITLDFRETGGPVGAMQRGADAVFSPVQSGFAAVVRPVGDFFGSILEIGTLRSRVRALEADNAELREQLLVQADIERRLGEAERLLSMSQEQGTALVGARVIAAPPGTFERSVLIDVGASQGVAAGMAVVNSRGVVGIVVEVTATRARVNLVTSTETGFGVRIAQTGDRGLLRGRGSDLLQLEMLDADPQVPLEAVVVTQAFQGSLVPGGLPIGVLEAPPDGDPAGERFLEVRPYVDFARLSTVAVVVAGREEDGQFGDGEVIDTGPLVDAPTVTVTPDPDAPAVPGLDFPAPTVTETGSPAPTASPGG
jgi:rod shape-determining protein MreC